MHTNTLGKTGLLVSELGFGGATLGNEYGPIEEREAEQAVHAAIDLGVTLFDVAPYYGRTLAEERLGRALVGRRHKVVLSTKCARYDVDAFDFSADRVRTSIDESLGRLRTDWVDIFLVHDVEFGDARQIIEETIPAMRAVQRSGKARCIGISGLPPDVLREIATAAPVDAILSYCNHNLLVENLEPELGVLRDQHGVGLINASPLHMGILTDNPAPDWHPAPAEIRALGQELAALCAERGSAIADVALRFALDLGGVASTLSGMSSREQVENNVRVADSKPDAELLREVRARVAPLHGRSW